MIKIYFVLFDKLSIKILNTLIFYVFKNVNYSFVILPCKKKKITVLKAPHVHKKAKEHYEIFFYKRLLILPTIFNKKVLSFLSLLPNNIRFKITYNT